MYDVALFAASCDEPETNRKFAESLGLDYPILSDPDKTTARAYGVLGALGFPSRTTIVVNAEGRIAFIDDRVRTSTHGADLARMLGTLGAPRRP